MPSRVKGHVQSGCQSPVRQEEFHVGAEGEDSGLTCQSHVVRKTSMGLRGMEGWHLGTGQWIAAGLRFWGV